MSSFGFTQESLPRDLMNLPAEVVRAGEESIEVQHSVDMLSLEIDMLSDELKAIDAAIYNDYKTGIRTLDCKITETAIKNAVILSDEVIRKREEIHSKKKQLLLVKKDLALKKLYYEALAFTKASSMKSLHNQLLRELVIDNIGERLDEFDANMITLQGRVDAFDEFKGILKELNDLRF